MSPTRRPVQIEEANIRSLIVRANCNMTAWHATRPRGRYRSSDRKSSLYPLASRPAAASCGSQAGGWPAQPLDRACPGPGSCGIRAERGSARSAETGCRRSRDPARRRWSRRCSSRLVLATATSASTGAIMPATAASARGTMAGRRSGAGAADQVTVTDSRHPALLMAPAASSRRQCARDSCTCCSHRPWLSRGRG